jgi:molybdate transport system permease protein
VRRPAACPSRDRGWRAGTSVAAAGLLVFLALPLASLLVRVPPAALLARLGQPEVVAALRLSLLTSLAATAIAIALGGPLAYLLATREFRGKRLVETVVDLPMVLPPTVAGFALLLAFGRLGLTGEVLRVAGIELPFTTAGVVVAQVFMATPFFVAPARAGFAAVDRGPARRSRSSASCCRWRGPPWWPVPRCAARARSASSAPRSRSPATCRA